MTRDQPPWTVSPVPGKENGGRVDDGIAGVRHGEHRAGGWTTESPVIVKENGGREEEGIASGRQGERRAGGGGIRRWSAEAEDQGMRFFPKMFLD